MQWLTSKVCYWARVLRILIYSLSLLLKGQPRGTHNHMIKVAFLTKQGFSPWPPPMVVASGRNPENSYFNNQPNLKTTISKQFCHPQSCTVAINISIVLQLHYKSKVIQKDNVIISLQRLHQKFRYQLLLPSAILPLTYFIFLSNAAANASS